MIRAVLFDLDGTLYDRDALADRLFERQFCAFESELRGISRERYLFDAHGMDEHGHGDKDVGYRRLVRAWGLDDKLATRLCEDFWATYDALCESIDAGTRDTLQELRRQGLALGVITNGQGVRQRRKLTLLGLDGAFDAVLVSDEEGVRKPDAEIFRRALARFGVVPGEAMFVGDHPIADVQGAHEAGLRAVWKYVPYWPPVIADAPVIRALPEILDLLKVV
jgi:putative hydrolase of the HAD superfamily